MIKCANGCTLTQLKRKNEMEDNMEARNKEEIRQAVRDSYGKVAKAGATTSEIFLTSPCCSEPEPEDITSSTGSCCSAPATTTDQMSADMGYSKDDLDSVPEGANLGLGCGNPVALASLKQGETIVDLGSGGGFDCFLAAKKVGENGKVIGVDMTPEMIHKARTNAEKVKATNVEFRLGEIEHLPIADNNADIIISNCVINLSPEKSNVYQDAFRVLKPGGRISISDILATAELPVEVRDNLTAISACVGGAATITDTEEMLKEAGFEKIKITPKDESREIINEWVPGRNAGDFVVSAYIEAFKPK